MTSYLLTWNPKLFSLEEEGRLKYKAGDEIRWSCSSKKPQEGDRVYLIRIGEEPRGIVASGIVTQPVFSDSDWKDPEKQRSYIKFRIEDLRIACNEGSLPMLLLERQFSEQQWSPLSSGIAISSDYTTKLESLWDSSKGKHGVEILLRWALDVSGGAKKWIESYKKICSLAQEVLTSGKISDKDLQTLWFSRNNGLASVGPGNLSRAEFDQNKGILEQLALEIFASPNSESLGSVINSWKEHGFTKTHRAVINRMFAAAAPDQVTTLLDARALVRVQTELKRLFKLPFIRTGNWFEDNQNLLNTIRPLLSEQWDSYELNTSFLHFYKQINAPEKKGASEAVPANLDESKHTQADTEEEPMIDIPAATNTIFYGPPGTGKTYHIVEAAMKVAEPEFSGFNQREELKSAYDELVETGRIRFVTFHQSYSYEEFVEGLRANTDETGQVSYAIEAGIFKKICEDAVVGISVAQNPLEEAINSMKEWLAENDSIELKTQRGNTFRVEYHGHTTFRAFPADSTHEDSNGYPVSIEHIRNQYRKTNLDKIYNPSYVRAILAYLRDQYSVPDYEEMHKNSKQENFVLVIGEINRGNISRIFGELITLIEPSKRHGQPEALSVTLPYSKESFSVPSNLHIIGTMNTADRSLAMMDTALRRRFDFKEMMPDYEILDDELVEGVCLGQLLRTMNERIEYLYDREHTLGHAFFMPVTEQESEQERFALLGSVFKDKIIPLLEEYFFEDWEKIRLVLGDNQKKDKALQFVKRKTINPQALFGSDYEDEVFDSTGVRYEINDDAFERAEAFQQIISKPAENRESE